MKKCINKYITAAALVLCSAATVTAQHNRTGYFLDDYTYRYQMNPAVANSKNFVAFPALGNASYGVNGTLGVKDVLYNVNGRTVTFMHPGVSASEVMSNIKDTNRFGVNLNLPILAVGFKGIGGYNTVTFSAIADTEWKIPGSIFSLLKEGVANKTYDIGNIDAYGTAYAQLALGHSRNINNEWRVGATLKVLFGLGYADLNMERADLELGTDSWRITTEGNINASVDGLRYETKVNSTTGHHYVSDVKVDDGGLSGVGLGLDLGAVYSPMALPDFRFSASVTDLGFINWNNNMLASTQGRKTFTTDAYTFNVDDNAPNSFDNEFDKIKDELSALYELSDMGDQGSKMRSLHATMNLGAEYTLPMYRALRFGLLNTTRFNGQYTWTDFRLSAAWAPCKIFDAALSTGVGTFGVNFGWLANLHCPGFNLFLGMDQMATTYSKDGVPLTSTCAFNLGINFLF